MKCLGKPPRQSRDLKPAHLLLTSGHKGHAVKGGGLFFIYFPAPRPRLPSHSTPAFFPHVSSVAYTTNPDVERVRQKGHFVRFLSAPERDRQLVWGFWKGRDGVDGAEQLEETGSP